LGVREKVRQILSARESPHRIAIAFATGVFIGMSPLLGIHTVLGIAVAWKFSLNRLVTLVGVYITNPWTIVPIYTFGTWTGAKILGMHDVLPDIDWNNISMQGLLEEFRHLVFPFILGSTIVGTVTAVVSYILVYRAAKSYHG
jgi:hypothetical protein